MPPASPRLAALATAVPPFVLRQDDVMGRAGRMLPGLAVDTIARLMPVYGNAGIETRYSCVPPDWYEAPHGWAELLTSVPLMFTGAWTSLTVFGP